MRLVKVILTLCASLALLASCNVNSRMIQGVFDDANPATRHQWAYHDTGVWDAQRNTNEFIAMFPTYAAKGLEMVTVGLQGGAPRLTAKHPEIVTAFTRMMREMEPRLAVMRDEQAPVEVAHDPRPTA